MAAKTVGTSVMFEKIQMQWFVTAGAATTKNSAHAVFQTGTEPPGPNNSPDVNANGQVPAGDYGLGLAPGTSVDVPFEVRVDFSNQRLG